MEERKKEAHEGKSHHAISSHKGKSGEDEMKMIINT